MFEALAGSIVTLLIVGLVVLVAKTFKREKEELLSPQEAAAQMTVKDKEEILKQFSAEDVPFVVTENISGQTTNLYVDWVESYGVRYNTIEDALDYCKEMDDEEFYLLEKFSASLGIIRAERMAARRYLTIHEMLDEEIYVYEPCKMKLDSANRLGQASRVAIEIVRADDLSLHIESIYVSKYDVTNPTNRYEFDMLNPEEAESFKLLVRTSSKFKDEIGELEKIEKHIARFNALVAKDRVERNDNGDIIIHPPSPEEIKQKRAELKNELFGGSKKSENSDGNKQEEAKKEVDEEFVSSTVLNN